MLVFRRRESCVVPRDENLPHQWLASAGNFPDSGIVGRNRSPANYLRVELILISKKKKMKSTAMAFMSLVESDRVRDESGRIGRIGRIGST